MKVQMLDGRTVYRSSIIVIDQITLQGQQCPVGLMRYDGGRYSRVLFFNGQWEEHPTDWRVYDTIEDARRVSPEITQSEINVADALADM